MSDESPDAYTTEDIQREAEQWARSRYRKYVALALAALFASALWLFNVYWLTARFEHYWPAFQSLVEPFPVQPTLAFRATLVVFVLISLAFAALAYRLWTNRLPDDAEGLVLSALERLTARGGTTGEDDADN